MKKYHYRMEGTLADGRPWHSEGDVECHWMGVMDKVMISAFRDLTGAGPYSVTRLLLTRSPREEDKQL